MKHWPDSVRTAILAGGLLQEASDARTTICPECTQACPVEVLFEDDVASPFAYAICEWRDDICRIEIPLEDLRQWKVSFSGLTALLARELHCVQPVESIIPQRLWRLGKSQLHAFIGFDFFLARGTTWPDATAVFEDIGSISGCRIPVFLLPAEVQTAIFGQSAKMASLGRLLVIDESGLRLDHEEIHHLIGNAGTLHTPSVPSTTPADPVSTDDAFCPSEDYSSVWFRGQYFPLTDYQAKIIRILHEAQLSGHPVMTDRAIFTRMGVDSPTYMSNVFRSDDPRHILIAREGRSSYRLNL